MQLGVGNSEVLKSKSYIFTRISICPLNYFSFFTMSFVHASPGTIIKDKGKNSPYEPEHDDLRFKYYRKLYIYYRY